MYRFRFEFWLCVEKNGLNKCFLIFVGIGFVWLKIDSCI